MEVLCRRLRELRKDHGLTQEQMGAIIGVHKGTISYYEKGRNRPSMEDLSKFADHFNISLDYFAGRDYQVITDNREPYGRKIRLSREEVRFIKKLRGDVRLHNMVLENPENLVDRMQLRL